MGGGGYFFDPKLTRLTHLLRESIEKKSRKAMDIFRTGGGAAQPHSIAFRGVFPNITEWVGAKGATGNVHSFVTFFLDFLKAL